MMDDPTEQWEYRVDYIVAEVRPGQDFVKQFYPTGQIPPYAVQSVLPRLNHLGEQGWELVQFQPVIVGNNGDILITGREKAFNTGWWTNTYLCAFKRRKPSQGEPT